VAGANADMERLAAFVDRQAARIDAIHVTLDTHHPIDIAHPGFWTDAAGKAPPPFTMITATDVERGVWRTRDASHQARALAYTQALERGGQYTLVIWPEHCLIGTWGHNVHAHLNEALTRWSKSRSRWVSYAAKGMNPFTEHYGALMAEVPDETDPGTALNTQLLEALAEADVVAVAGEASSHCVLTTMNQVAAHIGEHHLRKFHLLADCMSPVAAIPGADFPAIARAWLDEMRGRGMTVTTAQEF